MPDNHELARRPLPCYLEEGDLFGEEMGKPSGYLFNLKSRAGGLRAAGGYPEHCVKNRRGPGEGED